MQKRFHNFKDDDSTFAMARKLVGILEPGLYRGFDFSGGLAMILTLGHAGTGIVQTNLDGSATAPTGVWLTKQGVVVQEDAAVSLEIAGTGGHPRIDTIVGVHAYAAVEGGNQATYAVVQGVAAGAPVANELPIPETQVVLGWLYLPPNTTTLNGVGVKWTRNVPQMANNALPPTLAYTDKPAIFERLGFTMEAATVVSLVEVEQPGSGGNS